PSLILRLSFAHPSSHTRLRQLADFPSVKLRRREGGVILNFELMGLLGMKQKKRVSEKFCFVRAICQSPLQCK
ncbi:hypothetical protein, partial [Capnocytophaga bilenii]